MRLIDAEIIKIPTSMMHNIGGCYMIRVEDLQRIITEQPTAYDKEKVIDELEKLAGIARLSGDYNKNCVINAALRIIKQGGLN